MFSIPEVVKGTKTVEWQLNPTDLGLVGDTIGLKAGKTQVGAIVAQADIQPAKFGHLIVDNNASPVRLAPSQDTQNAIANGGYDKVQVFVKRLDDRFGEFLQSPSGNSDELLWSGNWTDFQQTFEQGGLQPQTFDEMLGQGGYKNLSQDRLYGTRVQVYYEFLEGSEVKETANEHHYIYRWVNAHDPSELNSPEYDDNILFHRTLADGQGGFGRTKVVDLRLPNGVNTTFEGDLENSPFEFSSSGEWKFDPVTATSVDSPHSETVTIKANGVEIGDLVALGTATAPTTIGLNLGQFKSAFRELLMIYDWNEAENEFTSYEHFYNISILGIEESASLIVEPSDAFEDELGFKEAVQALDGSSNADITTLLDRVAIELWDDVQDNFQNLTQGFQFLWGTGDVTLNWDKLSNNENVTGFPFSVDGHAEGDRDRENLAERLGNDNITDVAKTWALAEGLNHHVSGDFIPNDDFPGIRLYLPYIASSYSGLNYQNFGQYASDIASQEIAHTFGLLDAYRTINVTQGAINVTQGESLYPFDIMSLPSQLGNVIFSGEHENLLRAALGFHTTIPLNPEIQLFRDNFNLPEDTQGI
ncbi:MAG: hypothetical protein AAGA60_22775 [Cyanobacteria bacterium P01_E01_bin.42]